MIDPKQEDIGRGVVYTRVTPHEDGVITSFNENLVFVRYAKQHPSASGQGTRRQDLEWAHD